MCLPLSQGPYTVSGALRARDSLCVQVGLDLAIFSQVQLSALMAGSNWLSNVCLPLSQGPYSLSGALRARGSLCLQVGLDLAIFRKCSSLL